MNLFSHSGRLRRKSYLAITVTTIFIYGFIRMLLPNSGEIFEDGHLGYPDKINLLSGMFAVTALLIIWIQSIRRLHDANKSGWYSLSFMILPIYAGILIPLTQRNDFTDAVYNKLLSTCSILFLPIAIFSCISWCYTVVIKGTVGNNQYGVNPRANQTGTIATNPQNEFLLKSAESIKQHNTVEYKVKLIASKVEVKMPLRVILSITLLFLCFLLTAKIAADRTSYFYIAYHPTRSITGNHMFDIGRTWIYWLIFIISQAIFQLILWSAKTFPILKFENKNKML